MNLTKRNLGFLIIGVVLIAFLSGITLLPNDTNNSNTLDEIKIGAILPYTGDLSTHGEESKIAVDLAVSDFNIKLKDMDASWRLKVVHEDTATSPVIALEKLTSLRAKGIDMVVGPQSSAELLIIKGYANSNGITVISPSSTSPALAIADDNIYRLIPDDTKQGPALSRTIQSTGVNVIIPVYRADTWGDGLYDSLVSSFQKEGGIVDEGIRYNPESPEFSASSSLLSDKVSNYVNTYGSENVGVVILSFAEVLQFMQSASEHEILNDVRWFGSDGNTKEEKIIEDPIGTEFSENVLFTTTQVAISGNPVYDLVQEAIVKQLGRTPNSYAFSSYDATMIFGLSILETYGTDKTPGDVISDIAQNYNGAIGSTKLNSAGDLAQANYEIWGIRDGHWIILGLYDYSTDSVNFTFDEK